ncbi:MAG: Type 1 glutamine amidotransferase-like domain-containing protein [Pirellulaceae bacterium]|nr:Type 1 glutamine amidotransferase-like domain-containing protein [Pirellulaceae bacterium]
MNGRFVIRGRIVLLFGLLGAVAHAAEPTFPSGISWIDPAGLDQPLVICGREPSDELRKLALDRAARPDSKVVVLPEDCAPILPGAMVVRGSQEARESLAAAFAKMPGQLGIAVEEGAVLVVRGRRLEVLGEGSVRFVLAKSATRPAREITISAGEWHDLTMLRRAAIDRALPEFPPAKLPESKVENGSLVIVGGGGMPKAVVEKFIELAGGPDAPIVVLPTASGDMLPPGDGAGRMFTQLGAKRVTVLKQRTKSEVESPEFNAALAEAKGVWFGGGRHWRFIDAYAATSAETQFHDVLRRGGVIGGSSAGATILGQYMVRGSVLGNTDMMAEGYERGLNFLPGATIDQHFTQRKRQPDMTSVMRRFPQLLGIGIDEGTALVVRGSAGEVLGPGRVHFYDYRSGPPAGEQDYTAIAAGERYDLAQRKAVVTPAP